MREHNSTATELRPVRDGRTPRAPAPHPLLALQASAGNRAVAGLLTLQRCGPLSHDECPCDTDDEPKVQRLADGAGLVSSFAAPPNAFGAQLPELGDSLAELRAADGSDTAGRLPSLDQRPHGTAVKTTNSPRPVADPKIGAPRTPAAVSTPASALDAGPRPILELSGESDPALAHRAGEAALGELGATAGEADNDAAGDHGENAVAEAAPPVRVTPAPLTLPPINLAAPAIVPAGSSSPAIAQAESSLGCWLRERTSSAGAALRTQETAGGEQVDKALGDGDARLAKATEEATAWQHAVGAVAHRDVARERATWTSTTRSLYGEHVTSTKSGLSALDANVAGIVGVANRGARREYAEAEQAARIEEKKDPSLLDRAAGAFSRLKHAVGGLFDRARHTVKGLYDSAKSKVSGLVGAFAKAVRAGAAAVAGRIRTALARSKAAIAAKVRAAIDAVKTAAARLAGLGRRILEGVAKAVRAGLAAIGKAARAAMDALRKAAEAVKRAFAAVGRLLAKLVPYEPLPTGLYAWAERWKKLAEGLPTGSERAQVGGQPALTKDKDPLATGPAGGCGVCKGDAGKAGKDAHRIIQALFVATYGPNAFIEYPIPQKGPRTKDLSVDMARHRPDGALAIGEIKRGNESGYEDGGKSIAKYLAGIGDIDPTLKLVPMTELMPPGFMPNPEGGPDCPTQKLFVNPPVGGVYGYHCLPTYEDMMRSGKCKCKKDEPPDPPPIPVPVDEKEKDKEKDKAKDDEKEKGKDEVPDGEPLPDPAYAKAIYAAILLFCVAVAALLLWPEPIGKAVSAVAAIASFAAIMLMIGKAGGDAPPIA